jgi:hypothetical protein
LSPATPADQPAEDTWAEPDLDIDDDALAERAETLAVDRDVRLLARANRLAVMRERVTRHGAVQEGVDTLDIPLRCVAHAHPDCRFRWVRVTLDLSPTPGAAISDLSPRDEITEHPVKITTTYYGGLSFEIAHVPLKSELSAERTTERDVYFPTITTSGIGLAHAIWDFTADDGTPLHLDRRLRLLTTLPAGTDRIEARLTLRAAVAAKGVTGTVPLIGHHSGTIRVDDLITL